MPNSPKSLSDENKICLNNILNYKTNLLFLDEYFGETFTKFMKNTRTKNQWDEYVTYYDRTNFFETWSNTKQQNLIDDSLRY